MAHADTPTEVSVSTQTIDLMRSIVYDDNQTTDTEEGDDEEENKPPYLQRMKCVDNTNYRQREMSNALLRGNTTHVGDKPVQKWHPRKLDHNEWRKTNLDAAYGTLYAMRRETIAEDGELPIEPSTSRECAEGHLFGGVDYFHMKEKSYINKTKERLRNPLSAKAEKKRFSKHIIQEYKKPLKEVKPPGYGTPRKVSLVQRYNTITDIVNSLIKPNNGYNVMPKRQKAEKCDRDNETACQFCDVLGPVSCSMCIEATNRRIAHEVEEAAFPQIECTASNLVAPNLSLTMSKGDRIIRKKRVSLAPNIAISPVHPSPVKLKTSFALPPITAQNMANNDKKRKTNKQKKIKIQEEKRFLLPAIN